MFHQGEGVQVEDVHRDDQRCDVDVIWGCRNQGKRRKVLKERFLFQKEEGRRGVSVKRAGGRLSNRGGCGQRPAFLTSPSVYDFFLSTVLSLLVALGGVSLVFLVVVLVVPPDMTMLADCIMVAQMGSRSVSTTTT